MEKWDIYDKDRQLTGRTMIRGEKIPKDAYHLVIHVCIINSKNEMLIQQRQSFKDGWPNMWDITVGGSAVEGETSRLAAERELSEELGLDISFANIQPKLTFSDKYGYDDIYIIRKDIDIGTVKMQYEEVQNVKWATKQEILKMIENNQFIEYIPTVIDLFFEMADQYGDHLKK